MLKTRFYEKDFPDVDECVMVKVEEVGEMYSYVKLLEYGEIQGMMQFTELSRSSRIRSINKLIRVGKEEVCVVLRVDTEKNNIDLSKKKATPEDIRITTDRYTKAKTVHSIAERLAELTKKEDEKWEDVAHNICAKIIWPLYKKYGNAYDALKLALTNSKEVFDGLDIPEDLVKRLMQLVEHRMKAKPSKIRADVEVTCWSYEGIDAVKKALKAGEKMSTPEVPVKIQLLAPPVYVLLSTTSDVKAGLAVLKSALNEIEKEIKKVGGDFVIKEEPRTVTETDEKEFNAFLQQLKDKSQDHGDDDEDDEFIGMTGVNI
jgi:translation initiation factor 2 subunit 1